MDQVENNKRLVKLKGWRRIFLFIGVLWLSMALITLFGLPYWRTPMNFAIGAVVSFCAAGIVEYKIRKMKIQ